MEQNTGWNIEWKIDWNMEWNREKKKCGGISDEMKYRVIWKGMNWNWFWNRMKLNGIRNSQ